VNSRVLVCFAEDVLAKQRHVDNLEPFVDEQLFRVYHAQHYSRIEKLHNISKALHDLLLSIKLIKSI